MLPSTIVRPAKASDYPQLQALTGFEYYVHRHLDWKPPLDWLGCQPFFVLEQDHKVIAALACPEDPPSVAWVHLFASASKVKPQLSWRPLFSAALEYLLSHTHLEWVAIISLQTWLSSLVEANGFQHHQDIVVLELDELNRPMEPIPQAEEIEIRRMTESDVNVVAEVDRLAFHPIWQNSANVINEALNQAAYCSVAVLDGEVIGYQISTSSVYNAHLARLAVLPSLQRRGFARLIVADLIHYIYERGAYRLTVNTQGDNAASLALYKSMGFQMTGDSYPVYIYPQLLFGK